MLAHEIADWHVTGEQAVARDGAEPIDGDQGFGIQVVRAAGLALQQDIAAQDSVTCLDVEPGHIGRQCQHAFK